jgi:hypothetical protein
MHKKESYVFNEIWQNIDYYAIYMVLVKKMDS